MNSAKAATFVAGTAAVAVMIAGGKWGSHFRVPPVYVADVLVVAAFAQLGLRQLYTPRGFDVRPPGYDRLKYLVWLAAYCILRVAFSDDLNRDALRDAAPYIYSAVGLLAGVTVMNAKARLASFKVFAVMLVLHAIWTAAVTLQPSIMTYTSLSPVPIFYIRADFDYPIVALGVALLLYRFATSDKYRMIVAIGIVAGAVPLLNPHGMNRAGFVGSIVVLSAVTMIIITSPVRRHSLTYAFAAFLPIAIIVAPTLAQSTAVGERLFDTFNSDAGTGQGGYETMKARFDSWQTLIGWMLEEPGRAVVGAGFGENIMVTSGAGEAMNIANTTGDLAVRAPHNYWVNTYAHLGIPGLVFVSIPMFFFFVAFWRNRKSIGSDWFKLFVFLLPVALIVPASWGVVLESPFGAIPFWWCVGAVLALDYRPGAAGGDPRADWRLNPDHLSKSRIVQRPSLAANKH